MLREGPRSFSEMLEAFRIESPHLTYHLEALGDLLYKTKDGKYGLSTFGEAATSMMYQVEEAPRAPLHLSSLPPKWKTVFAVLIIGLILLGGLSYAQYHTLNRLSAEYERSKAEFEQLQQLMGQLFSLENLLTNEYVFNGSIGQEITFTNRTVYTAGQYVIYNPFENSTLEMQISFSVLIPPNGSMLLSVATDHLEPRFFVVMSLRPGINVTLSLGAVSYRLLPEWRFMYARVSVKDTKILLYKYIQTINVNKKGIFYASLPSSGWYILHFVPPLGIQGNYTTQYTISFRIKNQGMYVPFFVNLEDTKTFQFFIIPYILFYKAPP